jgi:hypothetical protein
MSLQGDIKFQKTLALAASASNSFEAEAAELAARRIMVAYNIDPTDIPDRSLYSRTKFTDNALLKRLRDEWREQHPAEPTRPERVKDTAAFRSALPFECDIKTFRRVDKLRKKNRQTHKWNFTKEELELIRECLNENWTYKKIAELLSDEKRHIGAKSISSARAWKLRSRQWIKVNGNNRNLQINPSLQSAA